MRQQRGERRPIATTKRQRVGGSGLRRLIGLHCEIVRIVKRAGHRPEGAAIYQPKATPWVSIAEDTVLAQKGRR